MTRRFWQIWIKDDRGRFVRLYPGGGGVASDDRKVEKVVYSPLDQAIFSSLSWQEVLCLTAPLVIGLFGALVVHWIPNLPKMIADWGKHAAIALSGPLWVWGYRSGQASRIRSALLQHNYCPSCGYALHGLEPQADGCRVCPECASAWRTPESIEERTGP
jgi:hypothetical protein